MRRNRTSGGAITSSSQGTDDADLMLTMREIAGVMSQSEGSGMNSMTALKEFWRQNPPVFNTEPDPIVTITKYATILSTIGLTPEVCTNYLDDGTYIICLYCPVWILATYEAKSRQGKRWT
ncbi:unnamed protein product [Ilex paraguariensis]|uniref:Uncharacterized protein n=1 Tax=Ilex paraguariensis TaxID=185542 RepID=A0ABC8R1R5_9AQUA